MTRRVVFVNHSGVMTGGAESVLLRGVDAMQEAGATVTAACPNGTLTDVLRSRGVHVTRLPDLTLGDRPRAVGLPGLTARSVMAAKRIRAAAANADAVVVNAFLALPAVRLARLNTPVAWLAHDVLHRRDQFAVIRFARPALGRAFAVSEAVAAPLRARAINTTVVRNATTWPPPTSSAALTEPPIVGSAAVLTPWKGQAVLLEAVARLRRPDVVVELAGRTLPKDGRYADQLAARANRPDLAGRVQFVGHDPNILDRVRRWRVAVVASVDPEATPLTLLEAMSLGVPVVATNHGGPPEILDGAGILVPPDDPVAMAEAIAALLDDHELWHRCSAAGPAIISDGHTLAQWATRFRTAIDALVNDRSAGGRDGGVLMQERPQTAGSANPQQVGCGNEHPD